MIDTKTKLSISKSISNIASGTGPGSNEARALIRVPNRDDMWYSKAKSLIDARKQKTMTSESNKNDYGITSKKQSDEMRNKSQLMKKYDLTKKDIEYNQKLDFEAAGKQTPAPVNHKEAFTVAKTKYNQSIEKDKLITPIVVEICHSFGGEMVGLEYKIKREDSLARKISAYLDKGLTISEAIKDISDSLRFTSVIKADRFTEHVKNVCGELEKKGFKISKIKNNFIDKNGKPSKGYKDMNLNFTDKSGFAFELQFNTPEGMKAKEGLEKKKDGTWGKRADGAMSSHFYYEQSRVLDPNDVKNKERLNYFAYMTEKIWQDVPIPSGVETINTIDNKVKV